jgi:hypothetical protein
MGRVILAFDNDGILCIEQPCGSCMLRCYSLHLMGSCFVVGLLFFGVYGALFNVLSRRIALYFVGDR